jgi:hypothetical protein
LPLAEQFSPLEIRQVGKEAITLRLNSLWATLTIFINRSVKNQEISKLDGGWASSISFATDFYFMSDLGKFLTF